jgi:hypothetical protein
MDQKRLTAPRTLGSLLASIALTLVVACSDREAKELRETNYCPPSLGCANTELMAAVDARCHTPDKPCALSLEEVFGDLDHVYFVELPARLDECTTLPVPDGLKRTFEPLCQYVLLEKAGQVKRYLRGACRDEVKARDDLRFGTTNNLGFVLSMAPGTRVDVTWWRAEGAPRAGSKEARSYVVEPQTQKLVAVDADKERCARSP